MLSPGKRQCHSGSTTTASWAHIFIQRQWLNKDPKKNSDPWKTREGTIAGSFSLCSLMFWNCQRFSKLVFSIEVWSVPSSIFVWTPNQHGQPTYLLPKHTYHSWGHSCSPASVAWFQVVEFSVACFPSTHTLRKDTAPRGPKEINIS